MVERKNKQIKPWHVVTCITICLIILACLFAFLRYLSRLNTSLRNERAVYVNEITGQLTRSITARREWLMSRIGSSASSFNQSDAASFAEVKKLFTYKEGENYTVLLISDTGVTYTLDGNTARIRDNDLLMDTLLHDDAQYRFVKASDGVDYWAFSAQVAPRIVDTLPVVAICEVYDVEQFRGDLYLGLFGDDGYTYIANLDGGIQLNPKTAADFIGYNLIVSLENAGIDAATADRINRDFAQKASNSLFAHFNGTDWAVQYAPLDDSDEMAVVIAPIAETSHETTFALRNTLFAVTGIVVGLAMLVVFVLVLNVNAAKERERQLNELELKNRVASTKNDFLAKMSHDIRTPLNAVIGLNYIAITQLDEDAPVLGYLRQLDTSAKYLLDIINDILDMSKIESGKMELRNDAFQIREIVDAVETISRKQAIEKGVDFDITIDDRLSPSYIGDRQRLTQVLMNLTNNAVKFTPRGGCIHMDFKLKQHVGSKDRLHLIVSDTGIGMSEEFMKNLFIPFAQDRSNADQAAGGTGLGLSIVKSFVDLMGGTISASSTKGKGTTFDIILDLERSNAAEAPTPASEATVDESVLKGKHMLLVEDIEINLVVATNIISRFGLAVDTAMNGAAALEKFKDSQIGYYDIIITDIQMPEMNGYEFADAVRSLARPDAREVPILAMSANAFDDDVRASLQHGMNGHLKKPVEVAALKAALLKYLGGVD